VTGQSQIFFDRVRLGQSSLVWVWVLENFPLKSQIFQFFLLRIKKSLRVRSKKYPDQRRVSLLFTVGQKYPRVRLGQGPFHKLGNKQLPKQTTKIVTAQIFSIWYYACEMWLTPSMRVIIIISLHYRAHKLILRDF